MTALVWQETAKKFFETGLDRGVLYPTASDGTYPLGVAWSGLISITESPSGAEASESYADNSVYMNLVSAEKYASTIEAYTYPDEFDACNGIAHPIAGVTVGQQSRKAFGLSYRTKVGNDTDGQDHAYKLHLVYGLLASPSDRQYQTINDSPEGITFSWEAKSTPVSLADGTPTSILTIDSRTADETLLEEFLEIIWGATGVTPSLPLPDAVIAHFTP